MLKRHIYTSFLLMTAATTLQAQETPKKSSATEWIMQEFYTKPLRELNPVFLNIVPFKTIGESYIGGESTNGNFRRPQEAEEINKFIFKSQRYQQLNQARAFGSFSFTNEWENNLTNTSMLNPYRGNPYTIADTTRGNWKKQWYELGGGIASKPLLNNRLSVGLDLLYRVGTGARQKDPRPVDYSKDLSVNPGISWKLNESNIIGLKGIFNFYNEELQISYNDASNTHYLFQLKGPVEIVEADIISYGSTFLAKYNGKTHGANLQYVFQRNNWLVAAAAGIHSREENLSMGTINPRKGGQLKETGYSANAVIQKTTTSTMHKLEVDWKQFNRTGREFHQDRDSITNLYYTFFSANFTSDLSTRAAATYSWMHLTNKGYDWNISGTVSFSGMDNRYVYPRNIQIADVMRYNLSAAYHIQTEKASFLLQARAAIQQRLTSRLELATPQKSSYVYNTLLTPDQAYLTANWIKPGFTAMYSRNFRSKAEFFIKGSADWIIPSNDNSAHAQKNNRQMFQLSIGAFY